MTTAAFAGCSSGEDNTGTGYLTTAVHAGGGDIEDFETLEFLVTKKYLKPVGRERKTIDVHDTNIDLVQLQGDWAKPIGSTQDRGDGGIREPLRAGEYEFLQLEVPEVVEATLSDGGKTTVSIPDEEPLKYTKTFQIRKGKYATFVAVISPVQRAKDNQYVLRPVIDEVEVTYRG